MRRAVSGHLRGPTGLAGVGEYTAGAIASIAFGAPVPAVDGNVLRVVSRITGDEGDIARPETKKRMRSALQAVMPRQDPGDFNQAMMELGAMVCLPNGAPRCGACPAGGFCRARREERTGQLPVKTAQKARRTERRTVYLIFHGDTVALRRRPGRGLLAGLWEYPNQAGGGLEPLTQWGIIPRSVEPVGVGKHVFSHIEWHMGALAVEAAETSLPEGWVWADQAGLRSTYAVPSAFQSFAKTVEQRLQGE